MTGTAATEAEEFYRIYNLDVVSIPTNKPMIRDDKPILFFLPKMQNIKQLLMMLKNVMKKANRF